MARKLSTSAEHSVVISTQDTVGRHISSSELKPASVKGCLTTEATRTSVALRGSTLSSNAPGSLTVQALAPDESLIGQSDKAISVPPGVVPSAVRFPTKPKHNCYPLCGSGQGCGGWLDLWKLNTKPLGVYRQHTADCSSTPDRAALSYSRSIQHPDSQIVRLSLVRNKTQ
ncbi:hypothetical protein CBL_05303 [Carabus blaptoides fortunei]